jgi:hypothetical protein
MNASPLTSLNSEHFGDNKREKRPQKTIRKEVCYHRLDLAVMSRLLRRAITHLQLCSLSTANHHLIDDVSQESSFLP